MRAVYLSGLLVVVLAVVTFWMTAGLQPGVTVLQFAWTPRGFGEIVHVWSPGDLARYRLHLPVDSLLLLAYGSFGWLLATRTAWATRSVGRRSMSVAAVAKRSEVSRCRSSGPIRVSCSV